MFLQYLTRRKLTPTVKYSFLLFPPLILILLFYNSSLLHTNPISVEVFNPYSFLTKWYYNNRFNSKDYYIILGLRKDASPNTVKSSYRKLARRFHPDKVKKSLKIWSGKVFIKISEAYDVLKDEEKKLVYDNISKFESAGQIMTSLGRMDQIHPQSNRQTVDEPVMVLNYSFMVLGVILVLVGVRDFFYRQTHVTNSTPLSLEQREEARRHAVISALERNCSGGKKLAYNTSVTVTVQACANDSEISTNDSSSRSSLNTKETKVKRKMTCGCLNTKRATILDEEKEINSAINNFLVKDEENLKSCRVEQGVCKEKSVILPTQKQRESIRKATLGDKTQWDEERDSISQFGFNVYGKAPNDNLPSDRHKLDIQSIEKYDKSTSLYNHIPTGFDAIQAIAEIPNLPASNIALLLLRRLSKEFEPVARARGWKVLALSEMCCCGDGDQFLTHCSTTSSPHDIDVGGYCVSTNDNRTAQGIHIRLRPPGSCDQVMFYSYEELVSVMAHELAHIMISPHNDDFFKLMTTIEEERIQCFLLKNPFFMSTGRRLGNKLNSSSSRVSNKRLKIRIKNAAMERQNKVNNIRSSIPPSPSPSLKGESKP